jgi:hypothetical protein
MIMIETSFSASIKKELGKPTRGTEFGYEQQNWPKDRVASLDFWQAQRDNALSAGLPCKWIEEKIAELQTLRVI